MLSFLYVTNAIKEKYMDPHCNSFDMFEMEKGKHYKRGLTSSKRNPVFIFTISLFTHTSTLFILHFTRPMCRTSCGLKVESLNQMKMK